MKFHRPSSLREPRGLIIYAALLLVSLALAAPAHAHRANVFAWKDGDRILMESAFSGGKPCQNAPITVQDANDGKVLMEVRTDEKGRASFAIPDIAREKRMDLRLVIKAGEGHQGEWIITAVEYLGDVLESEPAEAGAEAAPSPNKAAAPSTVPSVAAGLDKAALEHIVGRELDKRLGPINRKLAKLSDSGPGVAEIFGGIGWIIGLFGIAAWFKSKRS